MLFQKCSPTGNTSSTSVLSRYISHKLITCYVTIPTTHCLCLYLFQGVEGIKEYGIDKLVQAAASQLTDQLPESREAARTVLLELQSVYEKAHPIIKHETSSPSPLPEEEQTPEAVTWEVFCQSKLSALSAQAVLRVTSVVAVPAREGLVTAGSSSSSQL